jgi:hypothetical protein
MPQAKIGIIACDILKKEIEKVTGDDPEVVYREYIEYAKHVRPEEMKQFVIEKVNSLKGKVDVVFIGYAKCQALDGLPDQVEVPSIMLSGDDCVSVVLGPIEYEKEKAKCPGTYFCSPGWAETGMDGLIKEMHLDALIEQGYDPMYFADMIFDAYSRCLFVDTQIGERALYEGKAKEFADLLKLSFDCREGTLAHIQDAWARTKELAAKHAASY